MSPGTADDSEVAPPRAFPGHEGLERFQAASCPRGRERGRSPAAPHCLQLRGTVAPRRPARGWRVRLPLGPGTEPGAPGCSASEGDCVSVTQPHCADENPLEDSPVL